MDDLPPPRVGSDPPEPPDDEALDLELAEPERSPDWRDLLIAVAIIWSVELALGVVLVILAGGPDIARAPLGLLAATLVGTGVTFTMAYVFACAKYGRSLREGFSLRPVAGSTLLWCVVIGAVGSLAAALVLSAVPEGESLMTRLMDQPAGLAVLVTIALVLPPFEEVYYRGFLYPILAKHLSGVKAVVVVVLWFGLAHVGQLAGSWVGVPIVFTMGIIWTVMRYRTNSLVPGLVCHMTYNLGLVLLTLAGL